MATEYTDNYDLDLYVGEDKPNLRDQYNAAMVKIDTALLFNANNISNANNAITQIREKDEIQDERIDSQANELRTHATDIDTLKQTAQSQGQAITSNANAISSLNNRVGTAEGNISRLQAKDNELQQAINNVIPKWTLVKSGVIDISGAVTIPSGQRKTIEYKVERWGSLYHLLLGNNQKFAISRAYGGTEVVEIPQLQDIFPSNEFHQFCVTQLSTVDGTNQACSVVFSNNSIVNNKFAVEIPTIGTPMPINTEYFWVK